jgi:hypothetical protein
LPIALSVYGSPNNHLFHTLLVHTIWAVAGDRPALLRIPALVAGVLLIPATYALAPRAKHVAAAVVATLPILIDYSTIARGYTIVALCVIVSMIAGARALRDGNRAAWLVVAIAWAIGFWTIPVMLFGSGFVFVWLLAQARSARLRELLITTIGAAVLTLLLYAPVLVVSGASSLVSNAYVKAQSARGMFDRDDGLAAIFRMMTEGLPLWLAIALSVCVIAGIVMTIKEWPPLWIGVPLFIIPALAILHVWPYRRTWLFLVPIAICTAGLRPAAPAASSRRSIIIAMIVALSLAAYDIHTDSVWFSTETGSYRDAEGTTFFLASHLRDGDAVVATVPTDVPLLYTFARHGLPQTWFTDPRRSARCWIVVNANGPSLNEMLARFGIAPRTMQRVRATESGEVFLAVR